MAIKLLFLEKCCKMNIGEREKQLLRGLIEEKSNSRLHNIIKEIQGKPITIFLNGFILFELKQPW